jgi:hypothetical protein
VGCKCLLSSPAGELKSIVYVLPSTPGESLQMIGIEAGFDSPQVLPGFLARCQPAC